MLNTVKKVGPVLELFTSERPEWRMTEVAQALGMPKSSAHSLLSTLVDIGLLSTSENSRYRLGLRLLTLAERARTNLDFRAAAVGPMGDVAQATRETVLLSVLDRSEIVYVERVEGSHPFVRLHGVRIGSRVPAHCTAAGKVLLADRSPDEVRRLYPSPLLRQLTRHSIATIEDLELALEQARLRNVAYDDREVSPDACCVAAPVRGTSGSAIAAMSVALPASRFRERGQRIRDALEPAAEAASARIASRESAGSYDVRDLPFALPGSLDTEGRGRVGSSS